MAKDQEVTLTFTMSDGTTKDVSFVVPAGIDGVDGMLPPITAYTDGGNKTPAEFYTIANAAFDMDITVAEPTVVGYTQTDISASAFALQAIYPMASDGVIDSAYIFTSGIVSDGVTTSRKLSIVYRAPNPEESSSILDQEVPLEPTGWLGIDTILSGAVVTPAEFQAAVTTATTATDRPATASTTQYFMDGVEGRPTISVVPAHRTSDGWGMEDGFYVYADGIIDDAGTHLTAMYYCIQGTPTAIFEMKTSAGGGGAYLPTAGGAMTGPIGFPAENNLTSYALNRQAPASIWDVYKSLVVQNASWNRIGTIDTSIQYGRAILTIYGSNSHDVDMAVQTGFVMIDIIGTEGAAPGCTLTFYHPDEAKGSAIVSAMVAVNPDDDTKYDLWVQTQTAVAGLMMVGQQSFANFFTPYDPIESQVTAPTPATTTGIVNLVTASSTGKVNVKGDLAAQGTVTAAGGSTTMISGTSLQGDGTVDSPLTIFLSPQPDNQLTDESGLYVPPSGVSIARTLVNWGTVASEEEANTMIDEQLSVPPDVPTTYMYQIQFAHDNVTSTLTGFVTITPVSDGWVALVINPSNISGTSPAGAYNIMWYGIEAETFTRHLMGGVTCESGGNSKKFTRSTGGGNFSFGYPDTPGAANACGPMGSGVYWKITVNLSDAIPGDVNVSPQFWTNDLPCMEDGTLVSHRFVVDYVAAAAGAQPTVKVWLICDTVPTHTINIETKTITKLQRSVDQDSGLSSLYPEAPEGELANEPSWRRTYFYSK